MTHAKQLLALLACLLCGAATCESDLIDDVGFQLWCGERLCSWDLEEGEVLKVSTWHNHDYGVELVGSPVLLSHQGSGSASSVLFEVVSKVEPGAMVTVELDEDGDGGVDWVTPIPPSDDFVSRTWSSESSVRGPVFYVRKSGEGQAVIARLRATRE